MAGAGTGQQAQAGGLQGGATPQNGATFGQSPYVTSMNPMGPSPYNSGAPSRQAPAPYEDDFIPRGQPQGNLFKALMSRTQGVQQGFTLPPGDMGMPGFGGDPRFGGPFNANQSTNIATAEAIPQQTPQQLAEMLNQQRMGQGAGTLQNQQYQPYTGGNIQPFQPYTQGNMAQMQPAVQNQQIGTNPPPNPNTPLQGANTQPPNIFDTTAQGMNQSIKAAGLETMYRPENVNVGMAGTTLAGYAPQVRADQVGYNPVSSTNVSAERIDPTNVASTNLSANNVNAGQIAGTDLSQYTNPYESQVVQQSLNDLERSRLMQANDIGAQATRAGAFGGSRQALMESELNRNAMEQAAKLSSGLRQSGFQNAQQLAGQDIASRMQADLANQGANLQAGQSNQSAGLQASLANQQAGLTAGSQNQSAALQAALANQSTGMQAGLANQGAGIQTGLANQAANLQAGSLNANLGQQTNLANQAALNQTSQFNIGNQLSAALANQQAGLAGSQNRQAAASTLGNLSNLGFGQGMDLSNQAWQQGGLVQGINQMLIDAARNQYAGYQGAPAQSLGYMAQALGATPTPMTTTQSRQPGLFDYLTMASSMGRPIR